MMTRKDYVKTAEILNNYYFGATDVDEMIQEFVEMFASDNPNFDTNRFIYAVNKS